MLCNTNKLLTKEELKKDLEAGKTLEDCFTFTDGQECDIFKTDRFIPGNHILYIPDIDLAEISVDEPVQDPEDIKEILDNCYTGNDFIELCCQRFGSGDKAEQLFNYVDWQHPEAALDAGELDDDEDDDENAQKDPATEQEKEADSAITKATFVSEWDGGTQIISPCFVNMETKEVFDIETVDPGDSVDSLDREYIIFNDTEYTVCPLSEYEDGEAEFWYED